MSDTAELIQRPAVEAEEDNAKRRQIVDGARQVFLARGFDAASMGDIAKAAGVSKGTLYVYFKDKDELFGAIVHGECAMQAEGVFDFDHDDHDVEAVLLRHGQAFVRNISDPSRLSSLRTVIAVAERMPDLGRKVYETGPAVGIAKLTAYLRRAGRCRRAGDRRLRGGGGAIHRDLPRHHVQADAVQFRAAADARAHRACGRHRGADVFRGL